LLEKFHGNPPANLSDIRLFEEEYGRPLPVDYVAFLMYANGGNGFVDGHSYISLWRVEEITKLNDAYKVAEYMPGLLVFGSDGGGEAFAFDVRKEGMPIVAVPFIGMEPQHVLLIAPDFYSFLLKYPTWLDSDEIWKGGASERSQP
jgi:hypothetical protein